MQTAHLDTISDSKDSGKLGLTIKIAGLIVTLLLIIINWNAVLDIFGLNNTITVRNKMALPILVQVNNRSIYTFRIEPGEKRTFTLLSATEFPATLTWTVQRHKNNLSQFLGEAVSEEVVVDQGASINADNVIGLEVYFYPVIENNTDSRCTIIVNDGLTIRETVGMSDPHTTAVKTGYYKYAGNSNVTLECPDTAYYHGERNGRSGPTLVMEDKSGIVLIPIP